MIVSGFIRNRIKAARRRRAIWVRLLDVVRWLPTAEGRARLWTRFVHSSQVHQTSPDTRDERYPELFDLAATLVPDAGRILSFGCSTGEELVSLRRRFPEAEIIGAEINPRSRRMAAHRVAQDQRSTVLAPSRVDGEFDLILALAVLQREPVKIAEMEVENLNPHYSFARFDSAVVNLADRLRPGGIFCIDNAQYRVEESSVASALLPVGQSPDMEGPVFGSDGRFLDDPIAKTAFRKRAPDERRDGGR